MSAHTPRPSAWIPVLLGMLLAALAVRALLGSSVVAPLAALSADPPAVTIQPRGHFGGWITALAVPRSGGDHIYMGEGNGFTVYDVSDPGHPRQVAGMSPGAAVVGDIAISGGFAYLADGVGLSVVDIYDAVTPILVSSLALAGYTWAIDVADACAYVGGFENRLHIVDVSNPLSPTLLGGYAAPGPVNDVAVSGNRAYLAVGSSGVLILDVTNPFNPTLLGAYGTPGDAQAVQVVGTTAYVADGGSGLLILNVANPMSPTLLGAYDTPGWAGDLTVSGTTAYVADRSSTLLILNVTNSATPILWATVASGWSSAIVAVSGATAFTGSDRGLCVVDVTNPAVPIVRGSYERPTYYGDITVAGSYGYIGAMAEFWVVDMANPAIPRALGKQALSDSNWSASNPARVAVSGTLAYVAEPDYGVEMFNVANPLSPTLTGRYVRPAGATVNDVAVAGAYAYVPMAAGADGWLRILNAGNPAVPVLVGSYDSPGDARRVVVSGSVAFLADGAAGLGLVNVSNPAHPLALASVPPPTATTSSVVALLGNRAYVGSNGPTQYWLQAVDITNPAAPTIVASSHADGQIRDIAVDGQYVYFVIEPAFPESPGLEGLFFGSLGIVALDLTPVADYQTVAVSGVEVTTSGGSTFVTTTGPSSGTEIVTIQIGGGGHRCTLYGVVRPGKAKTDLCEVIPEQRPCTCGTEIVSFGEVAKNGWVFDAWQPGDTVKCPQSGSAQVTGKFAPFLTLDGSSNQALCYTDTGTSVRVLDFTLTASQADDWEVTSFTLQAFGNGDDANDIWNAFVWKDDAILGGGTYRADNGQIAVTFPKITLPRGQAVSFRVTYFMKDLPCVRPSREYGVSITHNARSQNFPPGTLFGSASGLVKLGCVKTEQADASGHAVNVYETIQEGVDAATPGMTVIVCSGEYKENVRVTKPLTIKGQAGGARPLIQAADANRSVFALNASGVAISFLDLTGATGSAGVDAKGNVVLMNMSIRGNGGGVFASGWADIQRSQINDNSGDGISGGAAVILRESAVSNNGGWGIVTKGSVDSPPDMSSAVSGNQSGGISADSLSIASGLRIEGNKGIGILARTHVSGVFMGVSGNTGHGIQAGGSVDLQGCTVANNQGYGIVHGGPVTLDDVTVTGNTLGGVAPMQTSPFGPSAGASASAIAKSTIADNHGDGIRLSAAQPLAISKSNIVGNSGYGVNNVAGADVNARGNWWGDAGGPVPGDITGTVAYTPWLTAMVGLVVSSENDPVYAAPGVTATTAVYLHDWAHPTTTVTLTVTDTRSWLRGPLSATLVLSATGTGVPVGFSVPAAAAIGSSDTVTVTAMSGSDPTAGDSVSFQIIVASVADLAVVKQGEPYAVTVGEILTYTIIVANNGPATATGVALTDTLPITVTYLSASASQGSCGRRNGNVVCALGTITTGQPTTVTLVTGVTAAGNIVNRAIVTGNERDRQTWNNEAMVETIGALPLTRKIYLPVILMAQ